MTKKISNIGFVKQIKYAKKKLPTHFGNKSNFGKTFFVETFNKIHFVQKLFCLQKKIGTGRSFVTKLF